MCCTVPLNVIKYFVYIVEPSYVQHFNAEHWKAVSGDGLTAYKKHWTMPSRDVTERKTLKVRSRGHCGLLCDQERLCQGFETTAINQTTLCHMAMDAVDSSPVDVY